MNNSILKAVPQFIRFVSLFIGTGFIAGSIVHFGEGVTTWDTAVLIVGIILFITASFAEKYNKQISTIADFTLFVIQSLLLAIGIGMASGGTQHFIDTPTYAAVLIPLGLWIGLFAFFWREKISLTISSWLTVGGVSTVSAVMLWLALGQINDILPDSLREGHGSHGYQGTSDSNHHPDDITHGEIEMAQMMGITVEELRNQTPEEHMQMMQEMMHGDTSASTSNSSADLSALPEATMPQIIEVSDGDTVKLEATLVKQTVDGVARPMYAYNGQIPGPIFKADQAAEFTVIATNNIDMDTTVHWHGLRIDNASDGVPDLTQPPIAPGESYTYTVTVPDEGVYWYHPHVREDKQQDMGLYGNLLVKPESDTAYPPANQEEILVLDDLLISNDALDYGEETAVYPLMGRYGNRMVVNGQVADSGQPALQLSVPQQSVVRYYITNVANTRTFRLNFGVPMKVMAGDVGRFESAFFADALTIAPAERYIVDVFYDEAGSMPLLHQPPIGSSAPLVSVTVTGEEATPVLADSFQELQENTDVQADIARYSDQFDRPVDKTLRLSIETPMDHGMMMHHDDDGIEWEDTMPMMNRMMTGKQLKWKLIDEETKQENMNINWQFTQGDLVKIRIINDKESAHPMQHPVHFHGQRFLVLSHDGEPVDNKVWKDTVLVPTGSSVDILMEMSNPGKWMFHCHIAEHLTNGMMGMFTVNPA